MRAQAPRRSTASKSEFAQNTAALEQLRVERRNTSAEQAEAEGALEQLRQIAGTVPTEDDLVQARALRDRLWRLIRRAWENKILPSADEIGSMLELPHGSTVTAAALADAFERLESQADSHADRLRREAGRVAQQAASLADLRKARQRLEILETQEKELRQRAEELHRQWTSAWASLGLDPLPPREMHAAGSSRESTSWSKPPSFRICGPSRKVSRRNTSCIAKA